MRRFLVLIMMLLAVQVSASSKHNLPVAVDLGADAVESARKRIPIMVFYMSDDCGYCEEVSDLYLEPMHRNGLDKGRFILRTINTSGYASVRGFNGQEMDHDDFADKEGVSFTPVIKFYDHKGEEIIPEIFGYQTPDFYGAYLEAAIEKSIAHLRKKKII